MRIMIVDNDPFMVEKLPRRLRSEGHRVYLAGSFDRLVEFVAEEGIALVIIEPALVPLISAIDLLRTLRRESCSMLFVATRLHDVSDRIRLLEAGADDCITKPFDWNELAARLRALLRRHPLGLFAGDSGMLRVTRDLWLDLAGHRLIGGERETPLTNLEFKLLAYLAKHEGVVLGREALLSAVWGPGYEGADKEVDIYVSRLRQKLEPKPRNPSYILTVWGRGYRYERHVYGLASSSD